MFGTFETATGARVSPLTHAGVTNDRHPVSAAGQDQDRPITATERRSMRDRLPSLIDNAANFRRLARQYRNEARLLLHSARMARASGDADGCTDNVLKARTARSKAVKCDSFANLCEIRAATMASVLGSLALRRPSAH
jgi:hypothetical protein